MNRTLWAFCCYIIVGQAFGQGFFLSDSTLAAFQKDNVLLLDGNYHFGSTALSNDLVLGLLRAEFISRDVRERNSDAISGTADVGQSISADIKYVLKDTLFGKPRLRSMLHAGHRNLTGISFTKELFDLTFFGNKPFENQEVDIAPTMAEQQAFQKFGWGVMDDSTLSWIAISFVKGQRLQYVDIEKAAIFTANDGRYIDAQLQGEYVLSDTANNTFGAFNGAGAAVDLELNRGVNWIDDGWISLSIQDLGVVSWNNNTQKLTSDSLYRYEGIEVSNVLDLDGVVIGDNAIQDTLGLRFKKESDVRPLPGFIRLAISGRLNTNITAELSASYRYIAGFTPLVALHGYYSLSTRTRTGLLLSYGGFNEFRAGVAFESIVANKVYLKAVAANLPGPVSDQAKGAEFGFGLGFLF